MFYEILDTKIDDLETRRDFFLAAIPGVIVKTIDILATGAAIVLLWRWFVVPTIPGAQPIGFFPALGLFILFSVFAGDAFEYKEDKYRQLTVRDSLMKGVVSVINRPVIAIVTGYMFYLVSGLF